MECLPSNHYTLSSNHSTTKDKEKKKKIETEYLPHKILEELSKIRYHNKFTLFRTIPIHNA
jgi:hypothetical protein